MIKCIIKDLYPIFIALFFIHCGQNNTGRIIKEPLVQYKNSQEKQIYDCIVNYIQFYKDNPKEHEFQNYFDYYSHYDVKIIIDTMIYRPDSLAAFVFFAVKNNSKSEYKYSGRALMAYRQTKSDAMQIYPIHQYNTIAMSTYSEAIGILESLYMNKLGKQTDNYGERFNSNVGSKDFWDKSLYFKKVNNGQYYYFQTYLKYGGAEGDHGYIPYHYPDCR